MKIFHNIKKIAGSLIIASILLLPFSDIKAQTVNFGTSGSGGSGSASLSGYINGLAPAIAQFPGCKSAIKSLFKGGAGDTSAGIKGVIDAASTGSRGGSEDLGGMEGITNLSTLGVSASSTVLSVPISSPQLEAIKRDTTRILGEEETIQKSTSNVDKNQNCLNAIGKAVVKLLIQNMTLSIVNWIQTGNSGGPFFVQNPSKFFADIAKNQILDFGLEINDSSKYPFGKSFMENVAIGFNNKFQDNAQYSLDKMIQNTNPGYSAASFSADFSQGGWNAWNAMVQVPANNPLGFNVMASNELNARLAGTTQSVAQDVRDSLQQANGFLGDERCTDPWGVTREEDQAALIGTSGGNSGDEGGLSPTEDSYGNPRRCKKWEYVTPGAVIGNTLTKNMNNNDNSLVSAETLNDAIAAILDATLARFSSELTNTGLAYMSTSNDLSFEQTDLGDMFQNTDSGTYSDNIFQTPWIKNHPGFDIKTGVTQALVDEQRTYVEKLNLYNDTLNDLIKWIRQLDYCIPGPNPDWETATLNATQNLSGINLTSGAWPEMGNITWDQMSQYDPTGITGIIGAISSKSGARKAAAKYLTNLFDVNVLDTQDEVFDQAGIQGVLNRVFSDYRKIINQVYFSPNIWGPYNWTGIEYMPGITPEARAEFKKITGYQQIIKDNSEKKVFLDSIITRLKSFKEKIDNGTITQESLDDPSSTAVAEFARLSTYFVSGDDIANMNNLYQEAVSERNYVKNDLLTGDFGCEKFMINLYTTNNALYSKYGRRQPYPYPIDHLYNPVWNGAPTPIPWIKNIPDIPKWNGEGFLYGSVYYNDSAGPYGSQCPEFISVVHFVAPTASNTGGPDDSNDASSDIGLTLGSAPFDTCNVLTRTNGFERKFGVY